MFCRFACGRIVYVFYFFKKILLASVSGVLVFVSSRRRNWWIEGSGAFNAFYFPMLSRFIIELELVLIVRLVECRCL